MKARIANKTGARREKKFTPKDSRQSAQKKLKAKLKKRCGSSIKKKQRLRC